MLRYGPPVMDGYLGGSGQNRVGDVRVAFRARDVAPGTKFVVQIVGRAGPVEVTLDRDGCTVQFPHGKPVTSAPGSLDEGDEIAVSFADLLLEVRVNGKIVTSAGAVTRKRGGTSLSMA